MATGWFISAKKGFAIAILRMVAVQKRRTTTDGSEAAGLTIHLDGCGPPPRLPRPPEPPIKHDTSINHSCELH